MFSARFNYLYQLVERLPEQGIKVFMSLCAPLGVARLPGLKPCVYRRLAYPTSYAELFCGAGSSGAAAGLFLRIFIYVLTLQELELFAAHLLVAV